MLSATRRPAALLLAIAALALLVLPFVTTFDDFLTGAAMHVGLDQAVQSVVPLEARLVVALLALVGVPASSYGSEVILHTSAYAQPLFISWNCTGWQSVLLLAASFAIGLRGASWTGLRAQVVCTGLATAVLLNVIRIAAVCLVAAWAGYVPAILFHDYGGTLMTIGWLLVFWTLVHRWLLLIEQPSGERTA